MENKNNTIKIIVIIAILGVMLLILVNTFIMTGFSIKNNKDLVVGAILPLSGDYSYIGQEVSRGIKLALDESYLDIKVIYEDEESFNSIAAINSANKLTNIDNIDVGLTTMIEVAKPIAPIFNNKKIPLLVVWDSTNFIYESDNLFSTGFSTEKSGEKMAEFAFNELKLRKIAVISHKDVWSEIISKAFMNKFVTLGGEIVIHETYNPDERDYRTALLKIKNKNVDAIYAPLVPPVIADFITQKRELGIDAQILAGDSIIQDVIDASGNAAEGIIFTNIYVENVNVLKQKYFEKFGEEPIDITLVSFGYDGLKTIENAYKINPNNLQQGLVEVIGPSGSLDRVERIYLVKEGQLVLIN
ncbi:MAG: penicillin-binding protein activator [archaeon]